jgi:hypothetical protein
MHNKFSLKARFGHTYLYIYPHSYLYSYTRVYLDAVLTFHKVALALQRALISPLLRHDSRPSIHESSSDGIHFP